MNKGREGVDPVCALSRATTLLNGAATTRKRNARKRRAEAPAAAENAFAIAPGENLVVGLEGAIC
jgi:hypothetical protein